MDATASAELSSPRDAGEGQASVGPAPDEWQPPPALEEAARIALRAAEAGIPIVYFGEPIVDGPGAPVDSASPEAGDALEVLPAGPAPMAEPLEPAPEGVPLSDAGPVLLRRLERPDGSALERVIEPDGEIVEHEVSPAGTVLSCRRVGSLLALRLVEQRPAAGGEFLQVARDEESGAVVRYAVARDGEPRAVALVATP